ncbi:MAG: PLP-dependent aminotransferase family protein [Cryobacterium sp.]|nr:PLP-dependent aminotransferase family protein [Cryobacterium sp.]
MNNDSSSLIVAELAEWIARAAPGVQLASTRELVARFEASPVTVQKALRTLGARGLIETRPGVGTFVRSSRMPQPLDFDWQTAALHGTPPPGRSASAMLRVAPQGAIALHSGYPDRSLLPERLVRAALARAARTDAALARSAVSGLAELQSWFARELEEATPNGVTPPSANDVIVLPGSQSGLIAAFRSLVTPGRPLLVESPTYWGASLAAAQAGVLVVPVPSGPNGPDPTMLDRAFEETGARAFYAQPNFANPTGAQWDGELTQRVLDVVRARGAFLIEDDWAHDFGITSNPIPVMARDDGGHVVYLRSLTKSVSPAIRVAAIVARGPARERIHADLSASSMYVSGVLQTAALDVVTQPAWRSHLRGLRQQLRARRDLLIDSLTEHVPLAHLTSVPRGGLNLWVRLPDTTDVAQLVAECEQSGVLIAPGVEWFPAEPSGQFIRLNYAGANPESFPQGMRVLGEVLERVV